jgi:DDE superfamily endonuclease
MSRPAIAPNGRCCGIREIWNGWNAGGCRLPSCSPRARARRRSLASWACRRRPRIAGGGGGATAVWRGCGPVGRRRPWRRGKQLSMCALVAYRPGERDGEPVAAWMGFDLLEGAYDSWAFIRMLDGLGRQLGHQPVTVIWDNLGTHHATALHAWAKRQPWLELAYLLAYAPELNPVEGCGLTSTRPGPARRPATTSWSPATSPSTPAQEPSASAPAPAPTTASKASTAKAPPPPAVPTCPPNWSPTRRPPPPSCASSTTTAPACRRG